MGAALSDEGLSDSLNAALAHNRLPVSGQKLGFRLLNRLNSPTRVAVFGANPGRSRALVNGLAKELVLPATGALPPVELAYGARRKTSTLREGQVVATSDGLCLTQNHGERADRMRVHVPSLALQQMSLMYAPLSGTPQTDSATVAWAQDWADMAIWSTDGFEPYEQELWADVPDRLKDNSYLALTNAEELMARSGVEKAVATLRPHVEDAFFGLFVVAAGFVHRALGAACEAEARLWQASGMEALRQTLGKRISSGRVADTDNVALFLKHHGMPVQVAPPAPAVNVPEPTPPDASAADHGGYDLVARIRRHLCEGAGDLAVAVQFIGPMAASEILETCVALVSELADMCSQSPQAGQMAEVLWEATDMLTLMQLEGDARAAEDAVSVLTQLRYDFEAVCLVEGR